MSAFSDTAMILAAGRGERMRPITDTLPKPLVPVAGRTLLDRQLDVLEKGGITRAVINISYLGEMIAEHLKSRKTPEILLSREETPLETGGGILHALPHLGQKPFFSLNSDVVLVEEGSALAAMRAVWDADVMDALLLLVARENTTGYHGAGDFFLGEDRRLTRRGSHPDAPYVFTGVQLLSPTLFAGAPQGKFSMNLLYDKRPERIAGVVHNGKWLHVGDPAAIKQAEAAL